MIKVSVPHAKLAAGRFVLYAFVQSSDDAIEHV